MQGLTFAEWELDRQCMKDAKGNAVAAPLNWVFSILATQGYYPRPSGYISPAEQAERDRENILKRELEAREARFTAEAEAWAAALSPAERETILGPKDAARFAMLYGYFQGRRKPRFQNISNDFRKLFPVIRPTSSGGGHQGRWYARWYESRPNSSGGYRR